MFPPRLHAADARRRGTCSRRGSVGGRLGGRPGFCLQVAEGGEHGVVLRDIAHRMPVMHKTRRSLAVDDHHCRHASIFEKFDLLPITLEHAVLRIGQADKRQVMFLPVPAKGRRTFRTDNQDHAILGLKSSKIAAQLRHMPAAERSEKSAVEDQQYILLAPEI